MKIDVSSFPMIVRVLITFGLYPVTSYFLLDFGHCAISGAADYIFNKYTSFYKEPVQHQISFEGFLQWVRYELRLSYVKEYSIGFDYLSKKKGLFGGEQVILKNKDNGEIFYSIKVGRNNVCNIVISEKMEIIVVEENDFKRDEENYLIFKKSGKNFILVETISDKNRGRIVYNMETESIEIQDFSGTTILTKQ